MARDHRDHVRPAAPRNAATAAAHTPREVAIARLRARLERVGFPRLQMALIVALTAGAGALGSWALRADLPSMALRYPAAVGIAYVVFFLLLWLWLRTGHEDWSHVNVDLGGGSGHNISDVRSHASSASRSDSRSSEPALDAASEVGGRWLGNLDGDGDAGWPLLVILLLLAALVGLLALMAGVVWSAPVLFAELLFDGVLAAGLYRHLRRRDVSHWTLAALRRTWIPFAAAAALAAAVGWLLTWHAPSATTLGQALGG